MATALVVFVRIVSHGWVEFDDPLNVTENPHLYPVSWDGIAALWRHAYGHLYVPVSYTLFAAEAVSARAIAGTGATALPPPWLFHACSLLLHVAAVVCVQRICGRFSRDVWAVSAGATLFAVHPLQVETVAWISEQRGLMAGVLGLVAILLFLRWERDEVGGAWRSPAYLLATAAFGAALLAKPVALTVPLIIAVLVRMRPARPWSANAAALVPWCAMALAAGWVARLVQPAELTALTTPPWLRPVVALDAVAFYLQRLVLPWNLCVAYGRTPRAVLDDPWSPLLAAAIATLLVAVAVLPRFRPWRAPLALFLIPLVPVLGFVPFVYQNQSTVADRYAYLAMLGPALATTVVVASVVAAHRAARLSGAVALACLAGLSWRQAGVWKDTGTLAVQACAVAPNVTGSWTLRSAHHLACGEPDTAVACARRAVELAPANRIALLNLASGLIRSGDAAAGAEVFRRLATLGLGADEAATIFYNRGVTHLAAGNGVEAAADFGIACGLVPGHPAATASLRRVLDQLGVDPDAARAPEGPGSDAVSPPVGPVPAGPGRHAGRGE